MREGQIFKVNESLCLDPRDLSLLKFSSPAATCKGKFKARYLNQLSVLNVFCLQPHAKTKHYLFI